MLAAAACRRCCGVTGLSSAKVSSRCVFFPAQVHAKIRSKLFGDQTVAIHRLD